MRLRSLLFVPGDSERKFAKAPWPAAEAQTDSTASRLSSCANCLFEQLPAQA